MLKNDKMGEDVRMWTAKLSELQKDVLPGMGHYTVPSVAENKWNIVQHLPVSVR